VELGSEALEHAFQEMFGMGEHGAFHKKAAALFANILKEPRGNWIDHLRTFYRWRMAANGLPWWMRWLTLRYHLQAYGEIRLAEAALELPYLCVREIRYETELTICEMAHLPLASAKAGFESIVSQQPNFVPAYIQLARIERLSGNPKAAKQWWTKANDIVPSHNFVLDYRRQMVPCVTVTSTRITGPIRRWLGSRLLLGKRFGFIAIVLLQIISWLEQSREYLRYCFRRLRYGWPGGVTSDP
jgi:hypothetical protein